MENGIYLLAGLTGVLVHCFLKAKDLTADARRLKTKFTFKDYFEKDVFCISLSVLSVLIWFFVFGEITSTNELFKDYIVCSFVGMGMMGSYILQKFFSNGKAYISKVMNEKMEAPSIARNLRVMDDGIGGSKPPKGTEDDK